MWASDDGADMKTGQRLQVNYMGWTSHHVCTSIYSTTWLDLLLDCFDGLPRVIYSASNVHFHFPVTHARAAYCYK